MRKLVRPGGPLFAAKNGPPGPILRDRPTPIANRRTFPFVKCVVTSILFSLCSSFYLSVASLGVDEAVSR